ncbi:MAG TPA: DUF2905 domain-containing protein [Terriglobales bacterium]
MRMGLGRLLIFTGFVLIVAGALVMMANRAHLPLGRLPGDIAYRGKTVTVYFPLATSILLSILLSLLLYFLGKFKR